MRERHFIASTIPDILEKFLFLFFFMWISSCAQYNPFLDGIQSPLVSSKVKNCLEESWPVILQATTLDSAPVKFEVDSSIKSRAENISKTFFMSGHSMVRLELWEYQFLWGLGLLVLFLGQQPVMGPNLKAPLLQRKNNHNGDSMTEEKNDLISYEIWLPVIQSLSEEPFFCKEFLTLGLCRELLQVWTMLGVTFLCNCLVVKLSLYTLLAMT